MRLILCDQVCKHLYGRILGVFFVVFYGVEHEDRVLTL